MSDMVKYEAETKKHLSRGEFKCAFDKEALYLAVIGSVLVVSIIAAFPLVMVVMNFTGVGDTLVIFAIPFYLVFGTLFAIILNGRTCTYEAGETEFVITGPGKRREFFYYNDVQDITTEELKLFGKVRGYVVTITTGVRDVEYRYIFGKNKVFTGIDGTPFYYLGLNSGLYVKTAATLGNGMEADDINMMFESMMVEQITVRNLKAVENEQLETRQNWRRQ